MLWVNVTVRQRKLTWGSISEGSGNRSEITSSTELRSTTSDKRSWVLLRSGYLEIKSSEKV